MVFFYLATGVVAGILGGIFLVSFFYNPEACLYLDEID